MSGDRGSRRAVVTGCAGFVGSHLTERLLADGWEVLGIDSFTDFYDRVIKEANLDEARSQARFELVEADLSRDPVEGLLDGASVVFHLAAQAGVRSSFGVGFEDYVRHNVLATQRLLEACARQPLAKFVYASSSSVYGDHGAVPTTETAPQSPRSPYGMTKQATEALAGVYHREFGVPVVGLRYFTVYGPRQRPDMAFTRFLSNALDSRPVTVYGDGRQVRDFTYVDDAVTGTLAAARHGRPGAVYNIGGGSRTSVREVLDHISALLGRDVAVEHEPGVKGDVRATCAHAELAVRELRFRPQAQLIDGLSAQAQWLVGLRGAQAPSRALELAVAA
jgi:UDP-glucuronate 4-epimerase